MMVYRILFNLFFISLLLPSFVVAADAVLPFTQTYNCAEQSEPITGPLVCGDGVSWGEDQSTQAGNWELITTPANNPLGGGGRGQRYWHGDGTSNNSGGVDIVLNSAVSSGDFFIRWYMRWEVGSQEWGEHKLIWFQDSVGLGAAIINLTGGGGVLLSKAGTEVWYNGIAWGHSFYPTGLSDGTWVQFEAKFGITSGDFQFWVDGDITDEIGPVLIIDDDYTGFTYGDIKEMRVGMNEKLVANGQDEYEDYDDIAISTSYIGPLAAGDIDGACGTSSGQSYSSLTSSSPNLCSAGTVASFTGTGPWTWGCDGLGTGSDTASNACSATKTVGGGRAHFSGSSGGFVGSVGPFVGAE